jgi:hypothetical protein
MTWLVPTSGCKQQGVELNNPMRKNQNLVEVALTFCVSVFTFFSTSLLSQPEDTNVIQRAKAFEGQVKKLRDMPVNERTDALTKMVGMYDLLVGSNPVDVSLRERRIPVPNLLIGGNAGWNPASDCDSVIARMFPLAGFRQQEGEQAVSAWSLMLHYAPAEAMTLMKPSLLSSKPTLVDVVRLLASMHRQPGKQLSERIPKQLWRQFYESSNPCYKIFALEKYDSTDQSTEELLALYRECLLGSFSYLEVRALEGIYRSKDYRSSVEKLLHEYINSNPKPDGTLPSYPSLIRDPVEGAKLILSEIAQAKMKQHDEAPIEHLQPTIDNNLEPQADEKHSLHSPKSDEDASIHGIPAVKPFSLLGWIAVTLGLLGLLWLFFLKRKP